jgi:hypothetical protein
MDHLIQQTLITESDHHRKSIIFLNSLSLRIVFDTSMKNKLNFKLTNGGLVVEKTKGGNSWESGIIFGDKGFSSGVTYWEVTINHLNADRSGMCIGITNNRSSSFYNKDNALGMSGNRHNCYVQSKKQKI